MSKLQGKIADALQPLVGLRLSLTKTVGNYRGFHFGDIVRSTSVLEGQYALHVSCPWRIESSAGIVTGSYDYYEKADDNSDPNWEPGMVWGNFQQQALRDLFGEIEPIVDTYMNNADRLIVEAVAADCCGSVVISLSEGYRLSLFPTSARTSQEWRLLPSGDGPHFVVGAGTAGWDDEPE